MKLLRLFLILSLGLSSLARAAQFSESLSKIDSETYLSTKNGLHLIFERIDTKRYKHWNKFLEDSKLYYNYFRDGYSSFEYSLSKYKMAEVWVAYVSYVDYENLNRDNLSDEIEMAVTVTTSEGAPFSVHMGITRNFHLLRDAQTRSRIDRPKHKNISMLLHSFAANAMQQEHPEKLFMLSNPNHVMRGIFLQAATGKGPIFLGNQQHFKFARDAEPLKNKDPEDFKGYNACNEKILGYSPLDYNKPKGLLSLENPETGEMLYSATRSENPEMAWFFEHEHLGHIGTSLPFMIIDLEFLANQFPQEHLG